MYQCDECGATFPGYVDWGLPCPNCGGEVHWVGNVEHDEDKNVEE